MFHFLNKLMSFSLKGKAGRKISSICSLASQIHAPVRVGPEWSFWHDLNTGLRHRWQGTKHLSCCLLCPTMIIRKKTESEKGARTQIQAPTTHYGHLKWHLPPTPIAMMIFLKWDFLINFRLSLRHVQLHSPLDFQKCLSSTFDVST